MCNFANDFEREKQQFSSRNELRISCKTRFALVAEW